MKDLTQHLIVENTPARIVTTIHQCISADIMKRPHFADIGPFLKNEGYMDQYEGLAAVGGNTPVALDRSLRRKSILNSPASNRPEEFRINIRSNRSSSSIHSSESSLASVPRSDIIIQKPSVSYQKERVLTQQQKNMIRKRRRCISFTLSFSVCAIAIIVVLTVLNQAGSNANSTSTATSNSIPNTTDTNTPITSPT